MRSAVLNDICLRRCLTRPNTQESGDKQGEQSALFILLPATNRVIIAAIHVLVSSTWTGGVHSVLPPCITDVPLEH
jgi:hypothetical protein